MSRLVHISATLTRILLGIVFFTAGVSKFIKGFPGIIGPVWLSEKLGEYGLGLYGDFIACSQALTGFLLLTSRFATLGAVILLPMLLNILMITISLQWRGTPYVVGFLLVLNTFLLVYDFHKLKFIISQNSDLKTVPLIRTNFRADILWIAGLITTFTGIALHGSNKALAIMLVLSGLGISLATLLMNKLK